MISMTPILSFIDLNGVESYRHLGMVATPEEFLVMGGYIADGHYLETGFRAFLKTHGLQKVGNALVTPTKENPKEGVGNTRN